MSRRGRGSVEPKRPSRIARLGSKWNLDLKAVRPLILGGIGFSASRAVLQWISPWPIKLVFDNVLLHHSMPRFLRWLPHAPTARLGVLTGVLVVVAVLLAFSAYAANALLANAGQQLVYSLRVRLFRHLERQSLAFHYRNSVGDLLSRLGGDVQAMQGVVVNVLPVVAENALTVSGIVVIMLILNWEYGLLTLALVPALFVTVRHYLSAIKIVQRRARDNEGRASSAAQQVLVALPVVQAFNAEEREATRYGDLAMKGLEASKRVVQLQSQFTPIVTATMSISTAAVIYFGARSVLSGALTPGDLLVFMSYLRAVYTPVRQLAKAASMLGRGQASAERVKEILETNEEVPQVPSPRSIPRLQGTIYIQGVSFSYPESEAVLTEIELFVKAGTRHALVGATGSGKSTLLRLIPRFADPQQGSICIDGCDIRSVNLFQLRSQIAFVPQEPALFAATVWENIAYGLDFPDRLRALEAARASGVHDVLASLRDGYDTLVGERGVGLSGGQGQCVAVARAMARSAPIVLLDEPTTGLDAATETVVGEALERLAEGRTTIYVTHQLGAVRNADRITVLSEGQVVEEGIHGELLESKGEYWFLQDSLRASRLGGV